jgi:hypothetical protein
VFLTLKILLIVLPDPSHCMNFEASLCPQNQDIANLRWKPVSHFCGLFNTERRAR